MGELVEGWQEMEAKKKPALVIDCACTDGRMGRAIQKFAIWLIVSLLLQHDCNMIVTLSPYDNLIFLLVLF